MPLRITAALSSLRRPLPKPTITLVRHAHTDMNAQGGKSSLERGWSGAQLDDLGIQQAQQAGKQLMGKGITHLAASDLPRNLQTAQIIGKMIGAEVHPTPMLRTWNTGDFTGGSIDQTKPALKQYFENPGLKVPGGESYSDFYDRSRQAMSYLMNYAMQNPGENVGAVVHSNHLVALDGILRSGVQSPVNPRLLDYSSDKQHKPGQIVQLTNDGGIWTPQKLYEPSQSLSS